MLLYVCVLSPFSRVRLFLTLWTRALQAPLSMGFSRQEYWSQLACLPAGDLPDPGIEPASVTFPALAGRFFTSGAVWEWHNFIPFCGWVVFHFVCVCVCVCIPHLLYPFISTENFNLVNTAQIVEWKSVRLHMQIFKYQNIGKHSMKSCWWSHGLEKWLEHK